MPFSFTLLVEFLFPGLIAFCGLALIVERVFPSNVSSVVAAVESGGSASAAVMLVVGLTSYFLGTTLNSVSNGIIRKIMAGYRRSMIRRKLGLGPRETIDDLNEVEQTLILSHLRKVKSSDEGEKLNEVYAAARTFCSLHSDRTANTIAYHWSLMRLSRAASLPLLLLGLAFLGRAFVQSNRQVEVAGFLLSAIQLLITFLSYRYREKFLIYTVFDTFFESSRREIKR